MTQIKDTKIAEKLPEKESCICHLCRHNLCEECHSVTQNEAVNEVLNTDLPDPHEVVGIDVEKVDKEELLYKYCEALVEGLAKAIAKSKDILTWKDKA